jgi:hypothetical protein
LELELLRGLPARFKRYLGTVALFGVGDFSHALLALATTTLLTSSMGVVQAAQVTGLLYDWWEKETVSIRRLENPVHVHHQ